MNKKNFKKINILFCFIAISGVILLSYEVTHTLGSVLFAVGFVATILTMRRINSLPLDKEEKDSWENIRAKGKTMFILKNFSFMLLAAIAYILFKIISNFWLNKSYLDDFSFITFVVMLILPLVAAIFAGTEVWKLREEQYKDSTSQEIH